MAKEQKLIDLAGVLQHETKAAMLVDFGDKQVWLAKSLVEYYEDGSGGIFTMPYWLAKEKELI